MTPKILLLSGSARSGSNNTRLLATATKVFSQLDCEPTRISLADYELPLFDGDLEAQKGTPENAVKLARLFHEHHGIMIACPEYNGSLTPLLKNTIDWVSRVKSDDRGDIAPYKEKFAALISIAPGQMGGVNGLTHLRAILSRLGMLVISEQVTIGNMATAFNDDDSLANEVSTKFLQAACESLVDKTAIHNLR
ncbi:MAG: NAD(P)H-dependent oxidoreductase [Rhizobiaceae bacterium]|nr:NAD(P)H-dependent oxidoreductase [Rhizobiaceae bacterium]MBL4696901.1 NAD(P)H-dependent oxidoreductase [Rhizobiaceae bacterium]